ncbi:MAG: rhomboid family intramembrane serine protease, partial [bacterium]
MSDLEPEEFVIIRQKKYHGYWATKSIIILSFISLLAQQIYPKLIYYFGLNPVRLFENGWVWQPITYQFLHGGVLHLLFNMFLLWFLGRRLEEIWGSGKFLRYYLICGIGAGLLSAVVSPATTIGASGAIYGILVAYGITFPNEYLYLYLIFPIKAKNLVVIFAIIEFVLSITSPGDNIAHSAHLAGMFVGIIYLKFGNIIGNYKNRRKIGKYVERLNEEKF